MKPPLPLLPAILDENLNTFDSTHLHAMTKPNLAPIPDTQPLEVLAKVQKPQHPPAEGYNPPRKSACKAIHKDTEQARVVQMREATGSHIEVIQTTRRNRIEQRLRGSYSHMIRGV
jgi:hypothetical protein